MVDKIYFSNETYDNTDRSCDILSRETITFSIYEVFLELYEKMWEEMAKNRLYGKLYNTNTQANFSEKNNTALKPKIKLYTNFKISSCEITEKLTFKERHGRAEFSRPGQAF